MQGKEARLLILLLGVAVPLGLCLGCTSEQWVKEYVRGEATGLQEALDRHTADAGRRQEELEKRQAALEGQVTEMRASLGTAEELKKKQAALEGQITEMRASLEATDKYPKKEEILSLRSEIEKKFAELAEMEEDLNRLKGLQQLDYTARDKELAALATSVNDAKRFVDMHVTEVLKAQSLLKNFIIEEVRVLRVEHQGYARELEVIKGRLQAIEGTAEKKEPPEM